MNLIAIAEVAAVYEALRRSSTVAQQVEDPLLSLLRLGLLLWQGFDSWPGNSPMPWCGQKKKKKKKKSPGLHRLYWCTVLVQFGGKNNNKAVINL